MLDAFCRERLVQLSGANRCIDLRRECLRPMAQPIGCRPRFLAGAPILLAHRSPRDFDSASRRRAGRAHVKQPFRHSETPTVALASLERRAYQRGSESRAAKARCSSDCPLRDTACLKPPVRCRPITNHFHSAPMAASLGQFGCSRKRAPGRTDAAAAVYEAAPRSDPVALNILDGARGRSSVRRTSIAYKRIIAACPFAPGVFEWTTVPRTMASAATTP